MGKSYGAEEKGDLLRFRVEQLTLVTDKGHPLYDPRVHWAPDGELAENIEQQGQLQAIIIRQNGRNEDGSLILEVVDGRRRVMAIRAANERRAKNGADPLLVEAIVKRSTGDEHAAMSAMVSANEYRREDPPSHKAFKAAAMAERGMTREAIAEALCVTLDVAKSLLALAELDRASKKAIDDGVLPLRDAKKLVELPAAERAPLLAAATDSPRGKKIARAQVDAAAKKRAAPTKKVVVRLVKTKAEIQAKREQLAFGYGPSGEAMALALDWVLGLSEDAFDARLEEIGS